jgi:hypothetical protein
VDINITLFDECKKHFVDYDCNVDDIRVFLFDNSERKAKQDKAVDIMKNIMDSTESENILLFLLKLANIERSIYDLQPFIREYVVHALYTYILGIYLNEKVMPFIGNKVNYFQWKLAALFHDISYPVEIANNIDKSYTQNIDNISYKINEVHHRVIFKTIPNKEFTKLQKRNINGDPISSFNAIDKCFKGWGLNIDPKKEYSLIVNEGKVCHGILSALTLLFLIDKMYQDKYPERIFKPGESWDETCFDNDIIPACSAIYLHNMKKPELFNHKKINPSVAPVAFLLKLCDSLQEWDRPKNKYDRGFPSTEFDIKIETNNDGRIKLIYYANIEEIKRNEIEKVIKLTLENIDFEIISR